jgi:hypothetical protein
MNHWTSSASNDVSVQDTSKVPSQIHSRLSAVMELFEKEDLHNFAEETLENLVDRLREIIREIRNTSSETMQVYMRSKDTMLQLLRQASIALQFASDQLTTKGRTLHFYKYLLAFQEYFEEAFEQKPQEAYEFADTIVKTSLSLSLINQYTSAELGIDGFSRQLLKCKAELAFSQKPLLHSYKLFCERDTLLPDQCDQACTILYALNDVVKNIFSLINVAMSACLEVAVSSDGCELLVILCYAEEQIRLLHSLIAKFGSTGQSRPKQEDKMKQEINAIFKNIMQIISTIPQKMQNMIMQCDQIRFRERTLASSDSIPAFLEM